MRSHNFLSGLFVFSVICLSGLSAHADSAVKPPFPLADPPKVRPKGEIFECKAPPAPYLDMNFEGVYDITDPTASKVDPEAEAAYRKDTKDLHLFQDEVARMVNTYTRSHGRSYLAATCALDWLYAWAKADALTGKATRQGSHVRKWALAAISSAYLQIAHDGRLDSKQKVTIKKWLFQLAKIVVTDYSKHADSSSRRNNHMYWAAWSVGVTGAALQNKDYFDWAMEKAKIGLIQIEQDGSMPLEMRRGSRAQVYHLFATMPLVMLAELGIENGIDLYGYNNNALHRLVLFDLRQLGSPDYIEHRAGTKQELQERNMKSLLTWLEPYNARFGFKEADLQKIADGLFKQYRPLYNRRVGGDATLLYGSKPKPVPPAKVKTPPAQTKAKASGKAAQ